MIKKLLLIVVVIPIIFNLVRSGYYPMHDDFQVIRTFEMDKCFKDGQFPCRWVPDMGFGYGYPQFNYYAPLPYYLMEIFHVVGFSFVDSVKIFVILITFASTFGMYFLARNLWKSETGAFVSAIFYAYLPFRAVDIYVRGALPELTAMAVVPFIFLYTMQSMSATKKVFIWLSLSVAILLLSHSIATLIVLPFIVLWIAFLVIKEKNLEGILGTLTSYFLGLGLSAFFVIPAWLERGYVHISTLTSGYFNYLAHFVSFKQMLFSEHWGYGSSQLGVDDDIFLGVGISHWVTAIFGVFAILLYRKQKLASALFFLALGLGSLFLMHQRSSFIWERISVLWFVQFPWRFLLISGFIFSLVAGGVGLIRNMAFKSTLVVLLISTVIMLNLGYFRPREWLFIGDSEKLTGESWTKAITASLYDYLPVSAKKGPDIEALREPVARGGKLEVVSGEKGSSWQRWKIDVISETATLELQMFYFPKIEVKVDGTRTGFSWDNDYGLINIPLKKGERVVEARLRDTPVRSISNKVSILSLAFLALALVKRK